MKDPGLEQADFEAIFDAVWNKEPSYVTFPSPPNPALGSGPSPLARAPDRGSLDEQASPASGLVYED